jgi:hypothetical protein
MFRSVGALNFPRPRALCVFVDSDVRRGVGNAFIEAGVVEFDGRSGFRSETVASLKLNPPWQRKQDKCWLKNRISPRLAESEIALSSRS